MFPATSDEPFTETIAVATPAPEDAPAVSAAVPRETLPAIRLIFPAGAVFPEFALTVTVTCVVAPWSTVAGLAAAEVVVATAARGVTLTVNAAEVAPLKLAAPL